MQNPNITIIALFRKRRLVECLCFSHDPFLYSIQPLLRFPSLGVELGVPALQHPPLLFQFLHFFLHDSHPAQTNGRFVSPVSRKAFIRELRLLQATEGLCYSLPKCGGPALASTKCDAWINAGQPDVGIGLAELCLGRVVFKFSSFSPCRCPP